MNRAEEIERITGKLRQVGVSDPKIAVVLGIEYQSFRTALLRRRLDGAVLPAPVRGVNAHLEQAVVALVHALSGSAQMCATDATLIITAHPTRLAMRDAAAKLVAHNIVDADEVAWLLGHLGGGSSDPGGKIDTTLAA